MKFQIAKSFERSLKTFYERNDDSFVQIQTSLMKIGSCYTSNGLNFEKVSDFYSFRVNKDIRIIATLNDDTITIVYVARHDDAYLWCNKNKPVHTNNGYIGHFDTVNIEKDNNVKSFLDTYNYLLEYGFEQNFVNLLNQSNKSEINNIIRFLSPEYQQLILNRSKHGTFIKDNYVSDVIVINNDLELENALNLCYDEWAVFVHSKQREIIDFPINKNLLISGGPGTGKTIALLWRYSKIYNLSEQRYKPVIICRSMITEQILKDLLLKFDKTIKPIFVREEIYKDLGTLKGRHLFIDEAQDLSVGHIEKICELLNNSNSKLTISIDTKQAVISIDKNTKKLELLLDICSNNVVHLNYCYRSTEQVINRAYQCFSDKTMNSWAMSWNGESPACPLYGIEIIKKSFKDYVSINNFIISDLKEKKINIDSNIWGIIIVGTQNELNEFHNATHFAFEKNTYIPTTCKGLEFLYGYVIYDKNYEGGRKKECRKFVAFSRFRDSFVEIEFNNKK